MSLLGSVSPIPSPLAGKGPQTRTRRGGEAEPNKSGEVPQKPASIPYADGPGGDGGAKEGRDARESRPGKPLSPELLIRDPVLRAAFLRAYRAWEKRQERTTT